MKTKNTNIDFFKGKDRITLETFRNGLQFLVNEAGSLDKFGEKIGFPKSTLSDVINGKRGPSDRLLAFFNLYKVEYLEPLQK